MPHSLRNRPASPLVLPQVRTIGLLRPLAWLALALRDRALAEFMGDVHYHTEQVARMSGY